MCKHQVLVNFYSQFCTKIERLKHFIELEVFRLNSQCHTFPKWATSVWANVRKFAEQLNLKCGKMRFQPTTSNQIIFGYFYRNVLTMVSFDC
jgi:hypothetical protein